MCGISGFADFNKQTPVEVLQKMNRTLVHRGPDGEGYAMYDPADARYWPWSPPAQHHRPE